MNCTVVLLLVISEVASQSLNRVFRAELHLDTGAYTSYGLNTAPSSLIGSKCVDVKGETSHSALSIFF